MLKFTNRWWINAIISGVAIAIATSRTNYILGWMSFVPLFMILPGSKPKTTFKAGFLCGLIISIICFYWMIPGAERFTGNSVLYGIGIFLLSSLLFSAFFGLITFGVGISIIKYKNSYTLLVNSLLTACIFCILESSLMFISAGFPWFDYHTGYSLISNLYFIQPAAFFGVNALSFVVIVVNYLIAGFITERQWLKLLIPAGLIIVYFFCGYFILQKFDNNLPKGNTISVAILSENIPPEVKWNDTTGNLLVARLLDINRRGVALKPNIALWSESAIPWTYKPNDDLVDTIIKITSPANITHIIGINTEVANDVVYNSAYCILPGGKVNGRYDKQVLLSLVEKPLDGKLIPFFSSNGFSAQAGGYSDPLNTPYGKAGIMICNESTVPAAANDAVKKGAQFIINMSNDGWFNDTYIVGLHFYNARLRAVETRKDVVVNSNNGLSGLIQACGRISPAKQSTEAEVNKVIIQPNNRLTLAATCPNLFVYCCVGILVTILLLRATTKSAIDN
jgi:apolipoprotein N-acyltransferase